MDRMIRAYGTDENRSVAGSTSVRGGGGRRGRPRSVNQSALGAGERRACAPFSAMDALHLSKAWVMHSQRYVQSEETLWVFIEKVCR